MRLTLAERVAAPIWWLVQWASPDYPKAKARERLRSLFVVDPLCSNCREPFTGGVGFCSQECAMEAQKARVQQDQNAMHNLQALQQHMDAMANMRPTQQQQRWEWWASTAVAKPHAPHESSGTP